MTYSKIAVGIAGLVLAASAQADVAVSLDAGTTGLGAHLVVPMETYLNGRFGFNYLNHNRNDKAGNLDYSFKTKLQTWDVLFDWYPMSKQFHLTGGLVYNNNQVRATAKPTTNGTYTINGTSYNASDFTSLAADVDYHKAAPYLGIGWGNALNGDRKWNLKVDVGAFFQGKPQANLVALGCSTSTAVCSKLTSDTRAESLKLTEDFDSYRAYPVVRLSASYAF